jgi:hypothetical protein
MKKLCGVAAKKPVGVNFFVFEGLNIPKVKELGAWTSSFGEDISDIFIIEDNTLKVKTLEGHSYNVPVGYVIIRGVQGEFYPCEPEIFNQTYNIV